MPTKLKSAKTQTRSFERQGTRAFTPKSFDREAGTIQLIAATGAIIERGWYREQLVISEEAVDVSRVDTGMPVLDSHNAWKLEDVLGTVESVSFEGDTIVLSARFSKRANVQPILDDIEAGIIRSVSVGYEIQDFEEVHNEGETPLMRATRWALLEVSLVPVPADKEATVRKKKMKRADDELEDKKPLEDEETEGQASRAEDEEDKKEEETREEDTSTDESESEDEDESKPDTEIAELAAKIVELCAARGLPQMAAGFIRSKLTLAQAKTQLDGAIHIRSAVDAARRIKPSLPQDLASEFLRSGKTLQQVRADLFERLSDSVPPVVNGAGTQEKRAAESSMLEVVKQHNERRAAKAARMKR